MENYDNTLYCNNLNIFTKSDNNSSSDFYDKTNNQYKFDNKDNYNNENFNNFYSLDINNYNNLNNKNNNDKNFINNNEGFQYGRN